MAFADNPSPSPSFVAAVRRARVLQLIPLYDVSGSIMFGWFRKRDKTDRFAEHMLIAAYRDGMNKFLDFEDIKEKLDTENEIRFYTVMQTIGIYQASRKKKYVFDETPFEHAVSLVILAIQCVHMLYKLAYPAGGNEVLERKEIVIQNVMTNALEADLDNPSERAIEVMSAATLLYGEMARNHNQLVRQIDTTWQRVFLEPSAQNVDALLEALQNVIRLQKAPSPLGTDAL